MPASSQGFVQREATTEEMAVKPEQRSSGDSPSRDQGGHNRPLRVLFGVVGAIAALAIFAVLASAAALQRQEAATQTARSATILPTATGISVVVRTAQHLDRPGDVGPLVRRLVAHDVTKAWVQVKQDENDEFPSGSAFYPSQIAPIAAGHEDGRLAAFIDELDANGVEATAWMPAMHDAQAAAVHPEWRAQTITPAGDYRVQEDWLCPFLPAVRDYQASMAREVAGKFPALTGLYLDFIRYDDEFACASPEALSELAQRVDWAATHTGPMTPQDLRDAGDQQDDVWEAWHVLRAEKIALTIAAVRAAVIDVRPDFQVGAFTLPFSSQAYEDNTESGQDLTLMAQAGLDEIVLMGYWDDWDKEPAWVRRGLDGAQKLVGKTKLGVVLDGDMGVRRTRLTLEALGPWAADAGWFNFGKWTESEFARLDHALSGHREGAMAKPDHVSVVIRIDTEPDYRPSYETVHPEMIDAVVDLLTEEGVKGTFITVGKLAELQPDAIARAAAAGHEIGSHSYDHEQIDSLPVEEQLESIDDGLTSLQRLGYDVKGFGAPRNSITDEGRDRLMDWNLEYDGSAAYDPMKSMLDVHYAPDSEGLDDRIVVVPFVMPNDYDARMIGGLSADEMLEAWTTRLDKVVGSGEPVFVLDVHQWLISKPDNLAALRGFIDYAQACDLCRVETLREAAQHARDVLDRYESARVTSGDRS